jgi:hypothetical protein
MNIQQSHKIWRQATPTGEQNSLHAQHLIFLLPYFLSLDAPRRSPVLLPELLNDIQDGMYLRPQLDLPDHCHM